MKDEAKVQCVVCERKVDQPTAPKKIVRPAPPFICSASCATAYNKVLLVKSIVFGAN